VSGGAGAGAIAGRVWLGQDRGVDGVAPGTEFVFAVDPAQEVVGEFAAFFGFEFAEVGGAGIGAEVLVFCGVGGWGFADVDPDLAAADAFGFGAAVGGGFVDEVEGVAESAGLFEAGDRAGGGCADGAAAGADGDAEGGALGVGEVGLGLQDADEGAGVGFGGLASGVFGLVGDFEGDLGGLEVADGGFPGGVAGEEGGEVGFVEGEVVAVGAGVADEVVEPGGVVAVAAGDVVGHDGTGR